MAKNNFKGGLKIIGFKWSNIEWLPNKQMLCTLLKYQENDQPNSGQSLRGYIL